MSHRLIINRIISSNVFHGVPFTITNGTIKTLGRYNNVNYTYNDKNSNLLNCIYNLAIMYKNNEINYNFYPPEKLKSGWCKQPFEMDWWTIKNIEEKRFNKYIAIYGNSTAKQQCEEIEYFPCFEIFNTEQVEKSSLLEQLEIKNFIKPIPINYPLFMNSQL